MLKGYKSYLILLSSVFLLLSGYSVKAMRMAKDSTEEEQILFEVNAKNKNGIFSDDNTVGYKVKLKSTYKETQEGTLTYDVLTDDGKFLSTNKFPIKLKYHADEDYNLIIPKKSAGFYRLIVKINTTSNDDTLKRVFGVSPEKISSKLHIPTDFNEFWKSSLDSLKKIPPQYNIIERKDLSTKEKKVYLVEMRSYGNVLIRGWLVIPTFGKKFPVHYREPGYGVSMKPNMDNDDFIAFDLNVRGSGNSQDQIKLNTEIYSTTGIEDRDTYIYRGACMDCFRGLDFLCSHANLGIDVNRIYIEAGSQGGMFGIITAAFDKRVRALTIETPLYCDIRDANLVSASYEEQVFPFKMFRRYKESHPGYTWEDFYKVFDYYDPQNFAPMVKCPFLMGIGLLDQVCPPRCSMAMYSHLGSANKEYIAVANTTHEVNFDYFIFQNHWLREQLRVP